MSTLVFIDELIIRWLIPSLLSSDHKHNILFIHYINIKDLIISSGLFPFQLIVLLYHRWTLYIVNAGIRRLTSNCTL